MGNGLRCKKCGEQETDHIILNSDICSIELDEKIAPKEKKRQIKELRENSGVCSEYISPDPENDYYIVDDIEEKLEFPV